MMKKGELDVNDQSPPSLQAIDAPVMTAQTKDFVLGETFVVDEFPRAPSPTSRGYALYWAVKVVGRIPHLPVCRSSR